MIYVLGIEENFDKSTSNIVFETNTESEFRCNEAFLKQLINARKIIVNNASIVDDKVVLQNWGQERRYNGLRKSTGAGYMVLCTINADRFKLARYDGSVVYVNHEMLSGYMQRKLVYNCVLQAGSFMLVNTYDAIHSSELKEFIDKKYKRYTAMSALLGRKMTFDYEIEGANVRLLKYTGEAKDVIIPDFVTSINQRAFFKSGIDSVLLGDGLRGIGAHAFEECNLRSVTIPESVEFIGHEAFFGNKGLLTKKWQYTDKIKLMGGSTVIIERRHINI